MSGEHEHREDVHDVPFVDVIRSASKSIVPSLVTIMSMIASGLFIIQFLDRIPLILTVRLTQLLLPSIAIIAMEVIALAATFTYVSRNAKRKDRSIRLIRSKESDLFQSIESKMAKILEGR
jgi:hypothetical protein